MRGKNMVKRQLITAAVAAVAVSQMALATTYTYTPTNALTDTWSLGTNWSAIPVSDSATELTFVGTNTTVLANSTANSSADDIAGNFVLNILDLQGTGPLSGAGSIATTGNAFEFQSNGATTPVVNLNAMNGVAGLTYNINNAVVLTNDTTFTGSGNATFNFKGAFSGSGLLTKSGSSVLTLSGVNTNTGGVTLNAGILKLGSTTALGATAGTFTINGGTIDSTVANLVLANNNAQTWGGDFIFTGTQNLNLGTGAVSLGANAGATRTIAVNANTLTVGGIISNGTNGVTPTVNLTKTGAGTLTLTNANTYTGTTSINAGTLSLNFNATGAPASNILSSSSSLAMGSGTLAISGKATAAFANSQTFTGLTLNAGSSAFTITDGNATNTTILNLGAITRNAGNTVNFTQPTTNVTISATNGYTTSNVVDATGLITGVGASATVGGTNWATTNGTNIVAYAGYTTLAGATPNIIDGSTTNVRVTSGSTGAVGQAAGTVTVNSLLVNDAAARTISVGSGNTLRLGAVGGILVPSGTGALTIGTAAGATGGTLTAGGALNTPGELVINNAVGVTVNSVIANNGTGAVSLTKSGAGALTLNGVNTYTGATYINGGTLNLASATTSLATSSGVVMAPGTTLAVTPGATLGSATFTTLGNITVQNNAAGQSPTLTTGAISLGGNVFFSNSPNNDTFNLGNGAAVTLTANNIALQAGSTSANSRLRISGNIGDGGNGYTININGQSSGAGVTLDGNNTFSGGTNVNSGAVLVLGSNTAAGTGPLTISGGTLGGNGKTLANPVVLAGNMITINQGGSLTLSTGAVSLPGNRSVSLGDSLTIGGVISDGGANSTLSFNCGQFGSASQVVTLNGLNTFGGGVTLNPSSSTPALTLAIGNLGTTPAASAIGTGTLTLNSSSGPLNINNTSGSAGTLSTNNAQVWNGNFTFTGSNSLNMGTGAVSLGINAGPTRTVTVNANTLTIGGVISDGTNATPVNSITKAGAGTLSLAGNNNFSGAVTVSAGTLMLNGSNAYTGSTTVSAGTLQLSGPGGSILNTSGVTLGSAASLILDNTGAGNNVANRFPDAKSLTLVGGNSIIYKGSDQASTDSTETIGALTSTLGVNTVTVTSGGTNTATLTAASFNHTAAQPSALINGVKLGNATSGVGQLLLTSAPTQVGTTPGGTTGINGSVKNTQIVPYFVGEATSTTGGLGTASGTANTFLTYNATTGLRPLNPTDEFDNWTGTITSGADNNVRLSGAVATYNPTTNFAVNSLVISSATANVLTIQDGKTLTDTSGAILFTATNTIKPSTSTGTLDFGSAEAMITVNSGVTGTISAPVTTTNGALTLSGAGSLVLSGGVTGASNLVLTTTSTGTITLSTGTVNNSGTITNSGTGTGGVTISGVVGSNVTGITQNSTTSGLTVSGVANTFVGPVNVLAGTLTLANDGSLGAAGNGVTLNNNSTLIPIGIISGKHPITLNNGGTFGTGVVAGSISGTGALSVGGTLMLSGANSLPGGIVENAGTKLTISSDANLGGTSNALTLPSSSNTLTVVGDSFTSFGTHTVTITSGNSNCLTLDIQSPTNTFTMDRVDPASPNSATTPATLLKTGQGTLDITVPQTYNNVASTGAATGLYGGVLRINAPAGGSLASAQNNLVFSGGTLYLLGKSNASFTQTMQNITQNGVPGVLAGGGNIVVDNNTSTGATTTTLNLGTIVTPTVAGSSLNIATKNLGAGSAVITTTTANDATGIVGGGRVTYSPAGAATGFAAITGGTTLGAYVGGTAFVTSGSTATVNYALSGNASSVATESVNTLSITTTGTGQSLAQTAATTLTLTTGGLLFTGANDYSITGGTLKSNTATNSDLIVHQYGSGALTIGSVIANGVGTSTLTKDGSGKLILTGTNTYTGATYVNGGVLSVDAVGEIGATAAAALLLNGGTLQATNTITTTHTLSLGGSGGTLDVSNGKTLNLNGVISSNGGLTIANSDAGNGTVVLGAANTFTGGVWINAGVLKQNIANALPANGNNALVFGTATTEKFQLNGFAAAFAGLTSASTNALVENASNTAATLTVNNGADNTFAGVLQDGTGTGKLSLVKGGGGKLTLSGANTFTGTTTILSGTLSVTGSITSAVTIGTSSTLSGNGTMGAVTVSGLLSPGNSPGQLTVSSLLLNSSSTSHMEIGGTNLGTDYDNVTITSNNGLTYGGLLEVVSYNSYDLTQAGSYNLFTLNSGTPSGDFSNVTVGGTTLANSGGVWTGISGGSTYQFTEASGVLTVTIPEPATVSLALGVASMGLLARRRRHA